MDKFSSMSISATGGRKKMGNWSGDMVLVKPLSQALHVSHLGERNLCGPDPDECARPGNKTSAFTYGCQRGLNMRNMR